MNNDMKDFSAEVAERESHGIEKRRVGPCTPAGVLKFLYNRIEELDAEELEFLSHSTELACHMAMNLSGVTSGIGCLVNWDDQPDKIQAGNFRDSSDVSDLLFTISNALDVIGELAYIGSEASFMLREDERAGALARRWSSESRGDAPASADLSIAAQAAVAKTRRSRTTTAAVEGETA
jgi:hypothetical protein